MHHLATSCGSARRCFANASHLLVPIADRLLCCGPQLDTERDKAAYALVETMKAQMPDGKPLTTFLRALLSVDKTVRPTAVEALAMPVIMASDCSDCSALRQRLLGG